MIEWQDLHHSELSVSQLYALLQLRCAVFVVVLAPLFPDMGCMLS